MAIAQTYASVIDVVTDWHERLELIDLHKRQIDNYKSRIEALQLSIVNETAALDEAVSDEAALNNLMKQFALTESWTTFINAALASGKQ